MPERSTSEPTTPIPTCGQPSQSITIPYRIHPPIPWESQENELEIAKFLHTRGAHLGIASLHENPLITAIAEGRAEFVEWLLSTDIDRDALYRKEDGHLLNALKYAREQGRKEIVKMLEAAGCTMPPESDSDAESNERSTAGKGDSRNHELIVQHMTEVFGPTEEFSLQEIFPVVSEGPSVAVNVISSADRVVIFTTGMSDEAMSVTEGQEDFQYAELMMQLPADWPTPRDLDAADEGSLWPFTWLRQIAYHPHLNDTWLGGEYTVISLEDPPTPLGPNTKQTCFLLVTSANVICQVALQNKVCNVYRVLPLYTEERNLLLEKGIGALWESLQAKGAGYVLDVDRANSVTG